MKRLCTTFLRSDKIETGKGELGLGRRTLDIQVN